MKGLTGPVCVCLGRGGGEPEALDCVWEMSSDSFQAGGLNKQRYENDFDLGAFIWVYRMHMFSFTS